MSDINYSDLQRQQANITNLNSLQDVSPTEGRVNEIQGAEYSLQSDIATSLGEPAPGDSPGAGDTAEVGESANAADAAEVGGEPASETGGETGGEVSSEASGEAGSESGAP